MTMLHEDMRQIVWLPSALLLLFAVLLPSKSRALVPPMISVCQLSALLPLSIHRPHMDIPAIHNTSAVCPPPAVHAPSVCYLHMDLRISDAG